MTNRPTPFTSRPWEVLRKALLLVLSLASGLFGCRDCASGSASSVEEQAKATLPAVEEVPSILVEDGWQGLRPNEARSSSPQRKYWRIPGIDPPVLEYLPEQRDLFLLAGATDFHNQHPASVMVTTRDPWEGAKCSAVLLSPRLALTAAHCVCERKTSSASGERGRTLMDASACANHTYVTTAFYGKIHGELLADKELQTYAGEVLPHPEFQLVLDKKGNVLSGHADLALIALQTPVERKLPPVRLAPNEVEAHEVLIMSGFGGDDRFDQRVGIRYFRKNKVTHISGGDRVLYEQQGTYLYDGFNGGPCFREDQHGKWLVGISSIGTEKELAFTSTFFHREWIQSESTRLLKKTGRSTPP